MKGTAKTDFTDSIKRLRDQRKAVADKLDNVKNVSVDSWTAVKGDVDSAMARLERSYDEVSARFETQPAAPATRKTY